jgi:hypothetical protein
LYAHHSPGIASSRHKILRWPRRAIPFQYYRGANLQIANLQISNLQISNPEISNLEISDLEISNLETGYCIASYYPVIAQLPKNFIEIQKRE